MILRHSKQGDTTLFAAGPAQMTMADYLHYMRSQADERPLYIFDRDFAAKAPPLEHDYRWERKLFSSLGCLPLRFSRSSVPPHFAAANDLFARLGAKVLKYQHAPSSSYLPTPSASAPQLPLADCGAKEERLLLAH